MDSSRSLSNLRALSLAVPPLLVPLHSNIALSEPVPSKTTKLAQG